MTIAKTHTAIPTASRVHRFTYAIRQIVAEAQRVEATGTRVRYLNIGDPVAFGFKTPPHLIETVTRKPSPDDTGSNSSRPATAAMEETMKQQPVTFSSDSTIHGLLQSAPHVAGIPILVNIPATVIVLLITWLLMLGVRESARANNIMVAVKLVVLALFVIVGLMHIDSRNYHPFAPNGWTGIHQGAAIVFFAYIGFDAISTAAEETKNPQRNLPIGILGGLAICTVIYVIVGAVLTGMVPYKELAVADPLARALELAGFRTVGWFVPES